MTNPKLTSNPNHSVGPDQYSAAADQPIEILRAIHSFDPCIACAVRVVDPAGEELVKVKMRWRRELWGG